MHPRLPRGYSFLRSFARTYRQVKDPIGSMEESMARFGGTYSVNLGLKRMIATQDAGFIEYVLKTNHKNYYKSPILTDNLGRFLGKGLLTSNGEYWLKQRRLIQPGFHQEKIRALYGIIERTARNYLAQLPSGEIVDVYPHMNRLAFEIVINTLFNISVPPGTRLALSRFITETQDFVIKDIRQPHMSWWYALSGQVTRHLREAKRAREIVRSIIRDRKQSGRKFNDLLDMLLDARYEDSGQPMEERQVIDEILILLIAGHETTANALSWTMFLLSRHPAVQHRLRASTRDLATDRVVRHDYLNAVINESMRLYPPAWISDRVALADDSFGSHLVPKGTIVALFYYGLHRDPQYWEEPAAFVPERFMKEGTGRPAAFFPFGAGPRLCIGNNFAMAEMTIFLQALVQQFEILPTDHLPRMKPLVTLRPDRVMLRLARWVS